MLTHWETRPPAPLSLLILTLSLILTLPYPNNAERLLKKRQVSIVKLTWLDQDSTPRGSGSLLSQKGRQTLYSFGHPVFPGTTWPSHAWTPETIRMHRSSTYKWRTNKGSLTAAPEIRARCGHAIIQRVQSASLNSPESFDCSTWGTATIHCTESQSHSTQRDFFDCSTWGKGTLCTRYHPPRGVSVSLNSTWVLCADSFPYKDTLYF